MISIRRYLILVIISLIVLVTFSAAIHGYRQSMHSAEQVFDHQLKQISELLTYLNSKEPSNNVISLPNTEQGALVFQIWQQEALILRSNNAPILPLTKWLAGFSDVNFNGQRWRVLNKQLDEQWLMVAQPLSARVLLAEQMILSAMTPLIWMVPFLALVIFLIIGNGLKPLVKLKQALEIKKIDDLNQIQLAQVPAEISPIIETLNQLFCLLSASLERERSFASDVAHELRTPISVLQVNLHNIQSALLAAQYLKNSAINNELIDDISEVSKGTERLAHVVEQILKLNKVTPALYRKSFSVENIEGVIQQVISDLYPQIADKTQQIVFTGQAVNCLLDKASMIILLQNILSNAIKYTPNKGAIEISNTCVDNQLIITCDDSGRGIPDDQIGQVFSRFYRLPRDVQSNEGGSGLGLAIVKNIVDLHEGRIELARSKLGGLKIIIRLPLKLKLDDKNTVSRHSFDNA